MRRSWLLLTWVAGCSLFPDTAPRVHGTADGGTAGTAQTGGAAGVAGSSSGGSAGTDAAAGAGGAAGTAGAAGCPSTTKPLTATADTYLGSPPNLGHGTLDYLEVTATNPQTGSRPLLGFDLTTIPPTATLQQATLELRVIQDGTTDQDVGAHHVLQAWTEGATWNKYDGTNDWTTSGGDFTATATSHFLVPANTTAGTLVSFDVTSDVSQVLKGSFANTGWILLDENPSSVSGQILRFSSREAVDPGVRPVLRVEFTACP